MTTTEETTKVESSQENTEENTELNSSENSEETNQEETSTETPKDDETTTLVDTNGKLVVHIGDQVHSVHGGSVFQQYFNSENEEKFVKIPANGKHLVKDQDEADFLTKYFEKTLTQRIQQFGIITQEEYEKYVTNERTYMVIDGEKRTQDEIKEAVAFAKSKGFKFSDRPKIIQKKTTPDVSRGGIRLKKIGQ